MSSSFRFLHAADLHIDSPLRDLDELSTTQADRIRRATRRAFENLVDLAIAERAAFVVVAGDIFDGDWRDFGSGLFLAKELTRLGAAGIEAYLLRGNHDAASVITRRLHWPTNVHEFDSEAPQVFEHVPTGTRLIGRSFANAAETRNLAASYPRRTHGSFTIGVLHTALSGRPGHDTYAPCTVEDLRGLGYDYWALGHVHAFEIVSDSPTIVFPGNLQGRHHRECGAKGCVLVEVSAGTVVGVRHHAVDVVRYADEAIDISREPSLDAVRDLTRAHLRDVATAADGRLVVARLRYCGATALDTDLRFEVDRLTAQCEADAAEIGDILVRDVRIQTQPPREEAPSDLREQLGLDEPEIQRRALEHPDVKKLLIELAKETGQGPASIAEVERELVDEARGLLLRRLHGEGGASE
ncbi:MAG: exonuclease SbcCD subunit D [Planctomycetota bacterium]